MKITNIFNIVHREIETEDIGPCFVPRDLYAHKGTFGHGLLISGKTGMAGAAILASRSCLRSGVGKLTVHTPRFNLPILQISVPEAIVDVDDADCFCRVPDLMPYSAVGIGPGLGTEQESHDALKMLLKSVNIPIVIDADAINILSQHKEWYQFIPANAVFTPHKKELERLIGQTSSDEEELNKTISFARQYHVNVVMKGHNSRVVTSDGEVYVNPTGNPGMATPGSGDVLTGIILSFLAQGYGAEKSALMGVYVHGFAGDIASAVKGEISLIASDIIDSLPETYLKITGKK